MLGLLKVGQISYRTDVKNLDIGKSIQQIVGYKDPRLVNEGPVASRIVSTPLDKYHREQNRIDHIGSAVQTAGTIFVFGVVVMQTLVPLPAAEFAGRVLLACWTLSAFRMVKSRGTAFLAPELFVQFLVMYLLSFSQVQTYVEGQLAIDVAMVGAGWVALLARWYLLFKAARLRTIRGDIELDRHRHRILSEAAARQ